MENFDRVVGLLGLAIAIGALLVAIFGIRDVREQVHKLLTMERNRTYTRLVHKMVETEFVDLSSESLHTDLAQLKHEFSLLARSVDDRVTIESALHEANNEILSYARQLVDAGYAKWKLDMDEEKAKQVILNWNTERLVGRMFGASK